MLIYDHSFFMASFFIEKYLFFLFFCLSFIDVNFTATMLELEKKLIDATAKYNCNENNNNTCSNNNIINTNNRGISNNLNSSHNSYYDGKSKNNIELQLQNNGMTPLSPSTIASPSSTASTKPMCSYVKYLNRTDNKSRNNYNNYNNDNNLSATTNDREVPSTTNYNEQELQNSHQTSHSKLLNFLCKENS